MKPLDRTLLESKLTLENYFPPFFSVILPELGRPDCVIRCVNHVMKHADMPFEAIVHDDGSPRANQNRLLNELGDVVSVLILNTGKNIGLGGSMNRCRKMASSNYLLKMDVDTYITSGIMKNMKAALDLPYCGIVNLVTKIPGNRGDKGLYVSPDGVKVSLCRSPVSTSLIFGIRGDVWDEAGGWSDLVQTTASDVGFIGNVFGRGYFSLAVEGTFLNEQWLSDDGLVSNGVSNPAYVSSARFASHDNNPPRINKISNDRFVLTSNKRREDIYDAVNKSRLEALRTGEMDPSWYYSPFYASEKAKIFPQDGSINWEAAKEHGHFKWKDQIRKDFNLE